MPISTPIALLTPLRRGLELLVTQAPGGEFSHDGDLYYGWDFAAASGSLFSEDVLAVADGRVVFVEKSVPDGGPTSEGGGTARDPSLGPQGALGNVVTIEHFQNGDRFYTSYLHLGEDSVPVEVDDYVIAGQVIGSVGNTGFRDGTHLHLNIGQTLGAYTNADGQDFPDYQIAEGPEDSGALLSLISFSDSPRTDGTLLVGDNLTSTVGPVVNFQGDAVLYNSFDENLVALPEGGYVNVFYESGPQPFGSPQVQILSDNLERLVGPVEIDDSSGDKALASVAVQADGSFAVAWFNQDQSNERSIAIRLFDASAAPISETLLFDPGVDYLNENVSLGAFDGGRYALVWGSQSRNDDGSFTAPELRYEIIDSEGVSINSGGVATGNQPSRLYAASSGQDILVAWMEYPDEENSFVVKATVLSPEGQLETAPFLLSDAALNIGYYNPTSVYIGNDRFAFVYVASNADYFDDTRSLVSAVFSKSGQQIGEAHYFAEDLSLEGFPAIAAHPGGGYAVLYSSWDFNARPFPSAVWLQWFGSSGEVIGEPIIVDDATNASDGTRVIGTELEFDASGDARVFWTVEGFPGPNGYGSFTDQGFTATFAAPVELSANNGAPELLSTSAVADGFEVGSPVALADLFTASDPDGLGDLVSFEFSDDIPGSDGGLFARYNSASELEIIERPATGPYRITVPAGELDQWVYVPANAGENSIQIEVTDSASNVSTPLIVDLTFTEGSPVGGSAPVVLGPTLIELDTAGSGDMTSISFDSSVIDVSDVDGDISYIRFYDTTPGEDGGYLALDGVRITDTFQDVGLNGLDRISYVAGPNGGFNDIVVEAFDAEGNDSNDLAIRINVIEPAPENRAPDVSPRLLPGVIVSGEPVRLDQLFAISDPDGNSDISSIRVTVDQNAILRLDDSEIGRTVFNFDEFARLTVVPTGQEPQVTVEASDGLLSDTASLTLSVAELQSASTLELEYFSRQSAYGYSPELSNKGDRVEADADPTPLEEFLDGWSVTEEFGGGSNTFRAIVLEKDGYAPVVAVRGTQTTLRDWAENFRTTGVGYDEFEENAISSGLRNWISENATFSITGHSQGGAQAQLLSVLASDVGSIVDKLYTFNSAGIPVFSSDTTFSVPNDVGHFVNASDVVSLVGGGFISGTSGTLFYYDFTDNLSNPLKTFVTAHTGHWAQSDLRIFDFYQGPNNFIASSTLPEPSILSSGPNINEFADGDFNPFASFGQDNELSALVFSLVGILTAYETLEGSTHILGIARPDLTTILSGIDAGDLRNDLVVNYQSRSGWEFLRENWGPDLAIRIDSLVAVLDSAVVAADAFLQLGQDTVDFWANTGTFAIDVGASLANAVIDGTVLAGKAVTGLGNFVIDTSQGAIVQTWLSASDVGEWIGERFSADTANIPFVGGIHSQSTAAILGNFNPNASENLSSSAAGSIFIVTDPNTQIDLTTGNNIVWGLATDYDGLIISGGIGTSDLLFIQNEFFDTEDLFNLKGSAIINVDLDQDGESDISITWEGDYRLESIVAEQGVDGTYIRYLGNALPIAVVDAFNVNEDQTLTGNILDDNGNGADIDPDGDTLMVSLLSGPSEGVLTLNDNGTFSYEADADVFDLATPGDEIEQSFLYQIDDGNGALDQATATISVTILDDGETIAGRNGKNDIIGTDGGEDILEGGNGKDRLFGLDGADQMFGGNGKDLLDGGEGPDKLYGGNGKDTLIGGLGDDELTGGKGDDTFMFALGEGTDTVFDFEVGGDLIGLDGLTFGDLSIGSAGDDATISSNGELLAVLTGVESASLSENDFFYFV